MIYCFDLDGTLCRTSEGDYANASPITERIASVNATYDAGHTVIIDTARGTVTGIDWTDLTTQQLSMWGVKYHTLRCGQKIYADKYIDDKAVTDAVWFKNTKGTKV